MAGIDLMDRHMAIAASPHIESQNGSIISTKKALAMPVNKLVVDIEPVQAGSGDPSPDNVRPISGWDGCNVYRSNENLLSKHIEYTPSPIAGVSFVDDGNGKITFGGQTSTASAFSKGPSYQDYKDYGIAIPPGTYKLGGLNATGVSAQLLYIGLHDTDISKAAGTTINGQTPVNTVTFTEAKLCLTRFIISANVAVTGTFFPILSIAEPSGDTVSALTTLSINWQSEAGTVYGGTLDVTTGLLTVDRAILSLKNNDAKGLYNYIYRGREYHGVILHYVPPAHSTGEILFTHGYATNGISAKPLDYADSVLWINGVANYLWVGILDVLGIETVEDYNAWLATQDDISIVFPLATPQTYQLTPTEVTLLLGDNSVWADTGDVTMKFWSH